MRGDGSSVQFSGGNRRNRREKEEDRRRQFKPFSDDGGIFSHFVPNKAENIAKGSIEGELSCSKEMVALPIGGRRRSHIINTAPSHTHTIHAPSDDSVAYSLLIAHTTTVTAS